MKNVCLLSCLTILSLLLLPSCENAHGTQGGWQKVYQNSAEGEALFGEKEKLIEAVRLGYPIRIGWGGNSVEHVTEATFLTIFQDEVFGQIEGIVGQAPGLTVTVPRSVSGFKTTGPKLPVPMAIPPPL